MTGYPPDDGAFPGRPGEEPFPGRPGGQHPHQQPGGQPYGGQQPPPGAYTGGYSAEQQPGQSGGQYGHHGQYGAQQPDGRYVPPGQPGFAPPPAGPPGQPPIPSAPGPSGPPRRSGGRALLVGASIAVVVLLVAGGLVVWNVTGSRPYASLPTCRQLLNDVVDEFPHAERPRVEGEYMEAEEYTAEYEYLGEEDLEGLEGVLQCNARETADTGEDERDPYAVALMWVNVSLYDAEDERVVEDLRTGIEEEIEDFEDGKWWGDELDDFELIDWTELTTGDGGRAMLHETSYGERVGTATARFVTANASVNISYTLEERYDEREEIEFLVSFSEQLERQLAREAERG